MTMLASEWIRQQEKAGVDWRTRPGRVSPGRRAPFAGGNAGMVGTDGAGRALVASPDVERRLAVCRPCERYQRTGGWGKCQYSACEGCYMDSLRRGRAPDGCERKSEFEI
jgi:hypothetical protein